MEEVTAGICLVLASLMKAIIQLSVVHKGLATLVEELTKLVTSHLHQMSTEYINCSIDHILQVSSLLLNLLLQYSLVNLEFRKLHPNYFRYS